MKKLKNMWRRMKQKVNEIKQKIKKKIPSWFKKVWGILAVLLLCGIIVEGAAQLWPALSDHKVVLAVASGRWIWPMLDKLIGKILRR